MGAPRIAINGLGRIGKLTLRALAQAGWTDRVILLNDVQPGAEMHAHLLEFDSVHGRWNAEIAVRGDGLSVNGAPMRLTAAARPQDLPLRGDGDGAAGVDLVIDCTGVFKTAAKLAPYFDGGARKVLVSAPVRDGGALNLVYGINHRDYDPARHDIVTAASCTTNALAPLVKVVHGRFGIRHGSITTLHDVTNTQVMADRPAKDLRRARSALNSLIPTTTGSATAIALIYPELAGRLDGHAVRVPLLNASLVDAVFEVERPTTAAEVNAALRDAAEGELAGILGYEARPLVSADFVNDPRSSVVDAPSTLVINGTQVKIYAWYDNEWGYAQRMADLARMICDAL